MNADSRKEDGSYLEGQGYLVSILMTPDCKLENAPVLAIINLLTKFLGDPPSTAHKKQCKSVSLRLLATQQSKTYKTASELLGGLTMHGAPIAVNAGP